MTRSLSLALAVAGAALAAPGHAALFELTYSGVFGEADALNPASGPTETFAGPTPFTLVARFDDTDRNYADPTLFPFPTPLGFTDGWVAYSPRSASIDIGGTAFQVAPFADDPLGGIIISIWDKSNFFTPGRYGIGFFVDAVADGAGVVGDFLGADPEFSVTSLVATTFTGYQGAGFLQGPCLGGPGIDCVVAPITLFATDGTEYDLTPAFRTEEFADGAPLNTASIAAVPLPGGLALLAAGLVPLGLLRRRRA